jgi:hypothetical protein
MNSEKKALVSKLFNGRLNSDQSDRLNTIVRQYCKDNPAQDRYPVQTYLPKIFLNNLGPIFNCLSDDWKLEYMLDVIAGTRLCLGRIVPPPPEDRNRLQMTPKELATQISFLKQEIRRCKALIQDKRLRLLVRRSMPDEPVEVHVLFCEIERVTSKVCRATGLDEKKVLEYQLESYSGALRMTQLIHGHRTKARNSMEDFRCELFSLNKKCMASDSRLKKHRMEAFPAAPIQQPNSVGHYPFSFGRLCTNLFTVLGNTMTEKNLQEHIKKAMRSPPRVFEGVVWSKRYKVPYADWRVLVETNTEEKLLLEEDAEYKRRKLRQKEIYELLSH